MATSIISEIGSIIKKIPFLGYRIIQFVQFMRLLLCKVKVKLKSYKEGFNINKTLWISPERIEYTTTDSKYDVWKDRGHVLGGDWDQLEKRFEDSDIYQTFKERFVNDRKWEDTAFYNRVLKDIYDGKVKWGCKNKDDWDNRLKKLELLYDEIKDNGYMSSEEIYGDSNLNADEEISVDIGRNGDFIFKDGRHRLSMAKLLNIPKVPVKVILRHSYWMEFRKELLMYANELGGKLYQPLTHPDLADIPSNYDDYRFGIIKDNLSVKRGKLLDIGAHMGYFCHKFEDEGFDCYAVESNTKISYFLKRLKRAENKKFKVLTCSIFNYKKGEELNFDVILTLNIFHHFLKEENLYNELIKLLKRLNMKEMFFQPHKFNENQMKGAYKNYHPQEFVDIILKYSCLNKSKIIGKTSDGRSIYKLSI